MFWLLLLIVVLLYWLFTDGLWGLLIVISLIAAWIVSSSTPKPLPKRNDNPFPDGGDNNEYDKWYKDTYTPIASKEVEVMPEPKNIEIVEPIKEAAGANDVEEVAPVVEIKQITYVSPEIEVTPKIEEKKIEVKPKKIMGDINVPKEAWGCIFTIKSIEVEKGFKCNKDCTYYKYDDLSCSWKDNAKTLGIKSNREGVSGISVRLNIKNIATTVWRIADSDLLFVDDEGYSYSGKVLCEECTPFRCAPDGYQILPNTQMDYIQIFPLLPKSASLSSLRVKCGNEWIDFNVTDDPNKLEELKRRLNEQKTILGIVQPKRESDSRLERFDSKIYEYDKKIRHLKEDMYSLENNILTPSKRQSIENRCRTNIFSCRQLLENSSSSRVEEAKLELLGIENEFQAMLDKKTEAETEFDSLKNLIESLINLSPESFEEYIARLYVKMGYSDVQRTQYVNDEGVDIIMYKDSLKYVVQCKRYAKNTVGRPEIQQFIGAMRHFEADKGIFVTTSMFSTYAEQAALEHPIELVNKVALAKMIDKFKSQDDSEDEFANTLFE